MTVFWKTDLMDTNTEIHLLPSHSCTIQRYQALKTRWPGLLLQAAFSDVVKPRGCISWPVWPLRGINKIAWGAKLIFTADLPYPVSCASLLMAQRSRLCLNVWFNLPTAPQPPPPLTLPPSHPPTPYRLNS